MSDTLSILIVDDNRTNLALMDMLLRKLPRCTTTLYSDPQAVIGAVERLDYDVAVIASRLPEVDGIALARRLTAEPRLAQRPILLAADEPDAALRAGARAAGIVEVLAKPIDPVVLRAHIQSFAEPPAAKPKAGNSPWDKPSATLPDVTPREEEYLEALVRVAGYRDSESPLHCKRVARYCAILAHNLGLPESFCRDIRHAAPLHDIGKAGLADGLLRNHGSLTVEERRAMENHTRIGHEMLKAGRSPLFRMAAEIALTHHERWDGGGYPQGLRGEQIPLAGRIAAIADAFDALTSLRSYKTAWSLANAFNYLQDKAGEHFDPACVAAFASGREEIAEVMRAMSDAESGTADAA